MAQRLSTVSCMQRTPAGLPSGMPGIGEVIDGAMQQAPQPALQIVEVTGDGTSDMRRGIGIVVRLGVKMTQPAQQRLHGHALHHDREGDHRERDRDNLVAMRQ